MEVPPALLLSLQNIKGFDKEAFERVHKTGQQITSIRYNAAKLKRTSHPSFFNEGLQEPIPWASGGYYLRDRPSFTLDPLFHSGLYYVQDASSMFLEEALRQTIDLGSPLKVLDLCAAPGGKSTLIQSIISAESLLVSNEVIKARANILVENITKWGAENVIVTNNDPKDFQRLPGYFDIIVVDAPCSGSGLFRKDPQAIKEWSINNVQLCCQRQQRILSDVMPSLKHGGILLYSTCSYSGEEDEDLSDWLISSCGVQSLKLQLKDGHGIIETLSPISNAYGYRFYPDKVKGEGFYLAAFKKEEKENMPAAQGTKAMKRNQRVVIPDREVLEPFMEKPGNFFFITQNESVIAVPLHLERELAILQSSLYIKKAGVKLGNIIRNELIPAHELAVSTIINPCVLYFDTDRETALKYLRKQDTGILPSNNKGWCLLTYSKLPLGWIKILPGRINNYYPRDWRILNK